MHFKYLMPHMVVDNLLLVDFQVFEVAPSLHMVELRKIGGDTLEFHNFYKSFSSGLKDVVWKSDQTIEGSRS